MTKSGYSGYERLNELINTGLLKMDGELMTVVLSFVFA